MNTETFTLTRFKELRASTKKWKAVMKLMELKLLKSTELSTQNTFWIGVVVGNNAKIANTNSAKRKQKDLNLVVNNRTFVNNRTCYLKVTHSN